jgi:hypothetical protein
LIEPAAIKTLRALLARYEQDEQRAGEALSKALVTLEGCERAQTRADARRAEAVAAYEGARAKSVPEAGRTVTAESLKWAYDDRVRLRELVAAAGHAVDEARATVKLARERVEAARSALGEAKGRREAVQKRIDEAVRVMRAKAEAAVEEEAADRRRGR